MKEVTGGVVIVPKFINDESGLVNLPYYALNCKIMRASDTTKCDVTWKDAYMYCVKCPKCPDEVKEKFISGADGIAMLP